MESGKLRIFVRVAVPAKGSEKKIIYNLDLTDTKLI